MGRHTKAKYISQQNIKNKRKKLIKKIILLVLFVFFLGLAVFSGIKIFNYTKDTIETKEVEEELLEYVEVDEETKEVKIDFDSLISINKDTKGYLIIPGTNISYPVVQTSNNEYYLNHNFKKNYNESGWLFADYENKMDGTDNNIVIYGHSMKNKTMFGELSKVLHKEWYSNPDNFNITYLTKNTKYTYKVFSIYKIKAEDYYINTKVKENEFKDFVNNLKSRNIIHNSTSIKDAKKIITLSTCYDNLDTRLVVHAVLISEENIG